jgi:Asp-tRNA(Asn)/Glu-tRNA(Gln) amidotransferase A subunit family amidase
LPTLAFAAVERITKGSYARIQRFCAEGRRLRERINAMLGDGGVLLMPTFPSTAFKHDRGILRPRHFLHAAIHNVLELPATTLPAGLSRDGLPLAVQVVAAHGRDEVALGIAGVLEQDGFAWYPPPLLRSKKSRRTTLPGVDG